MITEDKLKEFKIKIAKGNDKTKISNIEIKLKELIKQKKQMKNKKQKQKKSIKFLVENKI